MGAVLRTHTTIPLTYCALPRWVSDSGQVFNHGRRTIFNVCKVRGILCGFISPGDVSRTPALVDMTKAMDKGPGSRNSGEEAPTPSSPCRSGISNIVADAEWWAVGHNEMCAVFYGEVMPLLGVVLESPVPEGWSKGAGIDFEQGVIVETEVIIAFVEEYDTAVFCLIEQLSRLTVFTVVARYELLLYALKPTSLLDLVLKDREVEGEVVVPCNDKLQRCVDGAQEVNGDLELDQLGLLCQITAMNGDVGVESGLDSRTGIGRPSSSMGI